MKPTGDWSVDHPGQDNEPERPQASKPYGEGTSVTRVGNIDICCMAPEYRDCLDRVMAAWEAHIKELPKTMGGKPYVPGVYAFAYWLIRWSGLMVPKATVGPDKGHDEIAAWWDSLERLDDPLMNLGPYPWRRLKPGWSAQERYVRIVIEQFLAWRAKQATVDESSRSG